MKPELDQAQEAEDFYVAVDKYVAELMDGHAGVKRGHWPGRDSDSRRWPFMVARLQVWNPNGQLIESRPLKPTVPVQWTQRDLVEGRDPDMGAALDYLEILIILSPFRCN